MGERYPNVLFKSINVTFCNLCGRGECPITGCQCVSCSVLARGQELCPSAFLFDTLNPSICHSDRRFNLCKLAALCSRNRRCYLHTFLCWIAHAGAMGFLVFLAP